MTQQLQTHPINEALADNAFEIRTENGSVHGGNGISSDDGGVHGGNGIKPGSDSPRITIVIGDRIKLSVY